LALVDENVYFCARAHRRRNHQAQDSVDGSAKLKGEDKMSLLKGIYNNDCTGEQLEITGADPSQGTFQGTLVTAHAGAPIRLDVAGHYQTIAPSSAQVAFWAMIGQPHPNNITEAWALIADQPGYNRMTGFGGRTVIDPKGNSECPVQGSFIRQP
jgi:hypothetical protein